MNSTVGVVYLSVISKLQQRGGQGPLGLSNHGPKNFQITRV